MDKVEFSQNLGITITKIRLLTIEELEKYNDKIPDANLDDNRTISYLGRLENKPDNNFTEIGPLCYSDGTDTYSRIALEIDGVDKTELVTGDQFIFEGKFYTLLDNNLAISTFFAKNIETN